MYPNTEFIAKETYWCMGQNISGDERYTVIRNVWDTRVSCANEEHEWAITESLPGNYLICGLK